MHDETSPQPFWRTGLKALTAVAVTGGLFMLAAFGFDASAMRVALGISPELDVPYVETRSEMVSTMLEMADVRPDDYVIDLGTGDGRILLAAARDRGARGLGVDLDPTLVADARDNAERMGLSDRVIFRQQDLFETPLAEASVVTMFLLPSVNLELRPRLLAELSPGARVVSNRFDMGDWRPDAVRQHGGYEAYLWIIPAQVAGRWMLNVDGREIPLTLEQSFQDVRGSAQLDGETQLLSAVLAGDRMRFTLDLGGEGREFDALIEDSAMLPADGDTWQARRIGD